MLKIAKWARVLPGWLAFGDGPKRLEELFPDDSVASIVSMYQRMDPTHQVALHSVAKWFAAESPASEELNADDRAMTQ